MIDASKLMYSIGKIFNIIEIASCAINMIAGILLRIFAIDIQAMIEADTTLEQVISSSNILWILSLVYLILSILFFVISIIIRKNINYSTANTKAHILMIIIGVIINIFYTLGGIFGLVGEKGMHKE